MGRSTPKPDPPEQKPGTADPEVQRAVREAAERRARSRGYRSTVLGSMFANSSSRQANFGA